MRKQAAAWVLLLCLLLSCAAPSGFADTAGNSDPVHDPYLFPNEIKLMLPNEPLSVQDFAAAVAILFPEIPVPAEWSENTEPVLTDTIRSTLEKIAADESLSLLGTADTVTRAQFAYAANRMTGRTETAVVPADTAKKAVDIRPEDPYYTDLLEASVPHSAVSNGLSWMEQEIENDWREYEAYEEMQFHMPTERGTIERTWGSHDELFLIYLPYGYDPAQKYNVLLFLSGEDGDPERVISDKFEFKYNNRILHSGMTAKDFYEFLIQYGYCDPMIVVSAYSTMGTKRVERYIELLQYTAEHYSTYAQGSSVEDLVAARDHFAIAGASNGSQSICVTIQVLPDVFAWYGMFSGMYEYDQTVEAFGKKGPIRYLVMNTGENDYLREITAKAYEDMSVKENVRDSQFVLVENWGHHWMVFYAGLRELLFRFNPNTRNLPVNE